MLELGRGELARFHVNLYMVHGGHNFHQYYVTLFDIASRVETTVPAGG